MQAQKIDLWGAADLRKFSTPKDDTGQGFPFALTYALPMAPQIMLGIQSGPNRAYSDEYVRVNSRINKLAGDIGSRDQGPGLSSLCVACFRNVLIRYILRETFLTKPQPPWQDRVGSAASASWSPGSLAPGFDWEPFLRIFDLAGGPPMKRGFCGRCNRCVEACPAWALSGRAWYPGLPWEEILDVSACGH